MTSTLTTAQANALRSVKDGKVKREYRRDGNVILSSVGDSSRVLWALERMRMIRDGDPTRGGIVITCRMQLTKAGEDALHEAEWG